MMNSIIEEDLATIAAAPLEWSKLQGKQVLITGAAGFLPAYMVETVLYLNKTIGLDCRVTGLVRNLEKAKARFSEYLNDEWLVLVQGDVALENDWGTRFDFIIHAASQASPKYYGTDPVGTMTANIIGTNLLLRNAVKWKSEAFLYFSSGEVYGSVGADKVPTKEADYGYLDIGNVRSCYAESKRAGEVLAISYAHQYGIPVKIVRPFHTYGPGMSLDDGRVFADFVANVVRNENIVMRSDGSAIRAFCYLTDAVRGYFCVLLGQSSNGVFNVGNAKGVLSIYELACLLVSLVPEASLKVIQQRHDDDKYMKSTVSVSVPDVARLESLGWCAEIPPQQGFERTLKYFKCQS